MSDRVWVRLTVPDVHAAEVTEIYQDEFVCADGPFTPDGSSMSFVTFEFEDVSGGDLDGLHLLVEKGIAYTSDWEEGCEFSSGAEYVRFTPEGVVEAKEVSDDQTVIPISALMCVLDDPHELRKMITESHERIQVRPWDNQIEYGKKARFRQMLEGRATYGSCS